MPTEPTGRRLPRQVQGRRLPQQWQPSTITLGAPGPSALVLFGLNAVDELDGSVFAILLADIERTGSAWPRGRGRCAPEASRSSRAADGAAGLLGRWDAVPIEPLPRSLAPPRARAALRRHLDLDADGQPGAAGARRVPPDHRCISDGSGDRPVVMPVSMRLSITGGLVFVAVEASMRRGRRAPRRSCVPR
jgi:hypothetical protein